MKKLHKRTLDRITEYKVWIEDVKKLDTLQYKVDEFVNLLEEHQKSGTETWVCSIEVNVNINHTKEIPSVLRKAIGMFGKITYRNVEPEKKTFEFGFEGMAKIRFFLMGSSCILVETGEIIEKKKFKLVCSNGNEEEITSKSLEE